MSAADTARAARGLIRAARSASLATLSAGQGGWPYASLVMIACDQAGCPILLISRLAEHTANLLADGRASLLIDGTAALPPGDRLAGARLSLLARAELAGGAERAALRPRYLAAHPAAAQYADFGDFGFWRLRPERGHLVAGFGRIHWVEGADLCCSAAAAQAVAEAEANILDHMNRDHAEAIRLYATRLLGQADGAWRMTGCDAEGCDLAIEGGTAARLEFAESVTDAEGVRRALVALARQARAAA